jgi:hypothetical protein
VAVVKAAAGLGDEFIMARHAASSATAIEARQTRLIAPALQFDSFTS